MRQRGTEVAALFYSLIESAKLAGVGPHTYLRAATHAALRASGVLLPVLATSLARARIVQEVALDKSNSPRMRLAQAGLCSPVSSSCARTVID